MAWGSHFKSPGCLQFASMVCCLRKVANDRSGDDTGIICERLVSYSSHDCGCSCSKLRQLLPLQRNRAAT